MCGAKRFLNHAKPLSQVCLVFNNSLFPSDADVDRHAGAANLDSVIHRCILLSMANGCGPISQKPTKGGREFWPLAWMKGRSASERFLDSSLGFFFSNSSAH